MQKVTIILGIVNFAGDNKDKLKSFKDALAAKEYPEIKALKKEVTAFATQFPMP